MKPPTFLELDTRSQLHADAAIEALGRKHSLFEHDALDRVCRWAQQRDRLYDCIGNDANWCPSASLERIVERATWNHVGSDTPSAIITSIRNAAQAELVPSGESADMDGVDIVAPFRHSDGRAAVLAFRFLHVDEPVEWHGLFRSLNAFHSYLAKSGLISRMQAFDAIPRRELIKAWREAIGTDG